MRQVVEDEIRREFEEWFRSASAKDLDATMSRIADDVVSFEHEAPLRYVGIDAVREVCRQGFEVMRGELQVELHDLQVIVRDDIAVTWALNRMVAEEPGRPRVELWSRGTRVLQKLDGQWKLIHQHVSFPYDPATGRAAFDLVP
jgi:uncharacterized protein (TIGR02246 family)